VRRCASPHLCVFFPVIVIGASDHRLHKGESKHREKRFREYPGDNSSLSGGIAEDKHYEQEEVTQSSRLLYREGI
jgi:hypothetical protein